MARCEGQLGRDSVDPDWPNRKTAVALMFYLRLPERESFDIGDFHLITIGSGLALGAGDFLLPVARQVVQDCTLERHATEGRI